MKAISLALLLLPTIATAHDLDIAPSRKINNRQLMAELKASGCKPLSINRLGGRHWISMEVPCELAGAVVSAHKYIDTDKLRQDLIEEKRILEDLVNNETASLSKIRRLAKINIALERWAP